MYSEELVAIIDKQERGSICVGNVASGASEVGLIESPILEP